LLKIVTSTPAGAQMSWAFGLPPHLKMLRGMRALVKAVTRRYSFKQAGMGVGATALSILLHRDFRLTDISGKVVKKLLA
jgi:hypothetical protein